MAEERGRTAVGTCMNLLNKGLFLIIDGKVISFVSASAFKIKYSYDT